MESIALTVYDNKLIAEDTSPRRAVLRRARYPRGMGPPGRPLGPGLDGTPWALTVYDNKLIAGGAFTTARC